MKRAIIKGVFLGIIFALALMVLSTVMNQGNTDMTTEMGEATYPVVSMFVDGHRVNSLHGYTDSMSSAYLRETLQPVENDRKVSVQIDTYGREIESIAFEVRSPDGERLVENTQVDEYELNEDTVNFQITLKDLIENDTEYMLIFLVTPQGAEPIRYYSRIIMSDSLHIQEKLDLPVGIIWVAVGGTRIETWTSKEAYRNSPVFSPQLEASGRIDGLSPGERYEKLIVPFLPFAVKGFLWYQGENNCGMGDRAYVEKYKILVNSWRKAFRNENAPFYSVLLAPHIYSDRIHRNTSRPVTAEELPLFRDQQLKTLSVVSNTDIITISDLVDDLRDIHPSYKWEVGARLARVALAKDYGHTEIVWSGPRVKEATLIADSIVLSFGHVAAGLKTNNKKRLEWFEIAGSDGVFHPAVADIKDKDKVVVYHPEIKRPVKVRFGWHETAIPNLVN